MTLTDISLLRLSHQQVSIHDFKEPKGLVSWMGAMQAQDYGMSKWAMGVRLPGMSQASLQDSIDDGEIIRTHVMRPTWHLIAARDAVWMLDLTAPHIRTLLKFRHKELEITPGILKKATKVLEKNLAGGNHMTRETLLELFAKNKISTHDQRAAHIFLWAELEKVICSGAMQGKKNTYALFDERVKVRKTLGREEGLMTLTTRYFKSHGPATLQDFLNWSGLPVADGKRAIEMIREDLLTESVGSQTYFFWDAELPRGKNNVYLLPAFDEFIIGYKDRSACLPAKHKPTAIGINGMFFPVIVVNGQVIGLWKRSMVKNSVKVELKYFRGLKPASSEVKTQIDEAVTTVKKFFG